MNKFGPFPSRTEARKEIGPSPLVCQEAQQQAHTIIMYNTTIQFNTIAEEEDKC
jgi:hypothetical protein